MRPSPPDQGESNINLQRADAMGITGLKGTISSDDWAYTTAAEAQLVLLSIFNEQFRAYFARDEPNLKNAWITAEKADSNDVSLSIFGNSRISYSALGRRHPVNGYNPAEFYFSRRLYLYKGMFRFKYEVGSQPS